MCRNRSPERANCGPVARYSVTGALSLFHCETFTSAVRSAVPFPLHCDRRRVIERRDHGTPRTRASPEAPMIGVQGKGHRTLYCAGERLAVNQR